MPLLKDTRTAPPGGWRYTQPETGLEMRENSLPELVATVIRHRTYRRLPRILDFEVSVDIQSQICGKLGDDFTQPKGSE